MSEMNDVEILRKALQIAAEDKYLTEDMEYGLGMSIGKGCAFTTKDKWVDYTVLVWIMEAQETVVK